MSSLGLSNATMFLAFVILLLVNSCNMEVIDEIEYSKMPKLFTLEDYDDCLLFPEGYYCIIDIHLRTSRPSDLWYQIKNFSANTLKHYRHDILHKGICVTQSCNVTINPLDLRSNHEELHKILTECVNRELNEKYNLEGDVVINYCEKKKQGIVMTEADWVFVLISGCIILANIAGTLYHWRSQKREGKPSNDTLMAFSVIANWKKLMSKGNLKTEDVGEQRKKSLRGVQGMRFLTMTGVIFSHVVLIIPYGFVRNTIKIETPYNDPLMQLVYNGTLVVQTFFCMASFLMAYHFLIYIEDHKKPDIKGYFLMIIQRWLRLTPIYAIVLGFLCTLYEKMGSGPQWQRVISFEANACRKYWWINLLYLNNYIGDRHACIPQSWYLAADTQLFCYGALVMMIIWRFPNAKKVLFGGLVIIAVLVPGILTFKNQYFAVVPQKPESFRTLYQGDPTFLNIYITMQGNLGGYTIGLIGGCINYYFEKNNVVLKKIKWFRVWYALVFPLGVALVLSGVIFYSDDYVYNPLFAAAYAAIYKSIFGILVVCFLLGTIHKCDNIIRKTVEWEGFQILGRLTYCAYLLHTIPLRVFIGLIKQPFDVLEYNVICVHAFSITITYFIAWPLCVLIEMPFCNLQKLAFKGKDKEKSEDAPSVKIETIDKIMNGEPSGASSTETNIEVIAKIEDSSRL